MNTIWNGQEMQPMPRNMAALIHRFEHNFDLFKDELHKMKMWADEQPSRDVLKTVPLPSRWPETEFETLAHANEQVFKYHPISVPSPFATVFQSYPKKSTVIGIHMLMRTAAKHLCDATKLWSKGEFNEA